MTIILSQYRRLSTIGTMLKRAIRKLAEGLGFGLLCVMLYLVPLGIAYSIYSLIG